MNEHEQTPPGWEESVAALQQNCEASNQALTDALKIIIDVLEELRRRLCDLPPGCDETG